MKINWKLRLFNKQFWLACVPAILLLIQAVATPFGYKWDFANLGTQLTGVINAAFALLSIIGIAYDPTTDGFKDSLDAQQRATPKKEETK